ncbi:Crp/Fnr family transcriptional regulator [Lentilactobacillus sp. SPB1-3]|uniref:Crp/Fnr family transcriptional regulator n=1 Tax=Lentilactobacillus terminaliae TaxID=3003483 RepID=A0ACD5DE62_9LACO|nr:Crp/Fnr family transcriptional regulator [Lentilactobacillus sp. SPB1-3]MCZ0977749.1 Crp/Fnr family transcriptional regulator [Lentilactobacillus sp. SPB1-3]
MDEISKHHCVSLVPIFKNLDENQAQSIEAIVNHRRYEAGEFLYQQGKPINELSIIASGQAKVIQTTSDGKEQLLYLLQAGDINGEAALISKLTHTSAAKVLMPTTVCSINRDEFQKILLTMPQLSVNVLDVLGTRLSNLEENTTSTNTEHVDVRLASYLEDTAASIGENPFTLPITQADLASLLGTTPETISRIFAKWEKQSFIERKSRRKLKIIDLDSVI